MNIQNNNLSDLPPKMQRSLYPIGELFPHCEDPTIAGTVAVIMRTKNRPLLLHRALSSVLLQTYPKWRLYLVNDGGDQEILEKVLEIYRTAFGDRLIVTHQSESSGMESASNAGLALAQEEFAVVHDDDDSWHPRFLERTTEFLSQPINVRFVGVTTGCLIVKESIKAEGVFVESQIIWPKSSGPVDLSKLLIENTAPPICFLFRRSIIESIGDFNDSLPVLGDWDFLIRAILMGDIDFIPDILARYHQRADGAGDVYGNTVLNSRPLLARQSTLYRNSLLRAALLERPENLGAMQAMLHALAIAQPKPSPPHKDRSGQILKRLENLEKQNKILQRNVNRLKPKQSGPVKQKQKQTLPQRASRVLLAPARWLWRSIVGASATRAGPRD